MGAVRPEECLLLLSTYLKSGCAQQIHKSRYVIIKGSHGKAVGGLLTSVKKCWYQTERSIEKVIKRWLLSSELALVPASCGPHPPPALLADVRTGEHLPCTQSGLTMPCETAPGGLTPVRHQ